MKFLDLVLVKREIQLGLRLPEDHTCRSCGYYKKNNVRHGRCTFFKTDTCSEASCGKYKYYKANRKLTET